jgi:hypothetical protein
MTRKKVKEKIDKKRTIKLAKVLGTVIGNGNYVHQLQTMTINHFYLLKNIMIISPQALSGIYYYIVGHDMSVRVSMTNRV